MALALKLAGYPWDHITPLRTGEVVPEGIELTYDVAHGLAVNTDPTCHGGEASLGKFFIDTAAGDHEFVGVPVFPMFAFRHRCFLVREGTKIPDLAALEGKRVGIDGWPNSGNTWTRILLSQEGVDWKKIEWVLAPIEGSGPVPPANLPRELLANVRVGPAGKSLVDLTLSGDIDVMVAAFMPDGFFAKASPIVPMLPDYRSLEKAHFLAHGYVPAHHLLKLHREIVEREPWIVQSLAAAFTESKRLWLANRRHLADTTPWLLGELAESAAVFGDDWPPYGLEPNLPMLTDFVQHQRAQGLVAASVDPRAAFAESTKLLDA
jgi:4,5-dihydroxyphthalate decarboxylase